MLTPADIKNHQFQNLGRGYYKTEEVDSYIDEIYSSYSLVYNENKELIRKLNILASKIEEYRNDEQSIRNAIINAQRMSSKLIEEARKEAESIIEAAETKAKSADSITNVRIKKRIDEVEEMIKETFDRARSQAKMATQKAESDAKAVITDAKIKASEIIENAAKTSKRQLATIAEDINSQQSMLSKLKEESESFKNTMIKRYEDQIFLIRSISDFALNEIDESFSGNDPDSEATKSKVDEIIDALYAEKLSSFDEFSSKFTEDSYSDKSFSDSDMVFEDIYSNSDVGQTSESDNKSFSDDMFEDFFSNSFDDESSSTDVSNERDLSENAEDINSDNIDESETKKNEEENVFDIDKDDDDEDEDFVFNVNKNDDLSDFEFEMNDEKDLTESKSDTSFKISIDSDIDTLNDTFEFDFVDDDE